VAFEIQDFVSHLSFCVSYSFFPFSFPYISRLVYRDIKPENIGFDIRGDVKVFDLGLCKGLSPALKAKEYGYNLTPRTGSVPYMAPEVAECKPYDQKSDVFGFAILVWELLALKKAYQGYSQNEFLTRVVRQKERLSIHRSWPPLTRIMVKEAWDDDPQKRPDMKRVAVMVRGDLNDMTSDAEVQDRTQHLRERSAHSFRMSRGLTTLSSFIRNKNNSSPSETNQK
jgi:serine/threonine protein kinase